MTKIASRDTGNYLIKSKYFHVIQHISVSIAGKKILIWGKVFSIFTISDAILLIPLKFVLISTCGLFCNLQAILMSLIQ